MNQTIIAMFLASSSGFVAGCALEDTEGTNPDSSTREVDQEVREEEREEEDVTEEEVLAAEAAALAAFEAQNPNRGKGNDSNGPRPAAHERAVPQRVPPEVEAMLEARFQAERRRQNQESKAQNDRGSE